MLAMETVPVTPGSSSGEFQRSLKALEVTVWIFIKLIYVTVVCGSWSLLPLMGL